MTAFSNLARIAKRSFAEWRHLPQTIRLLWGATARWTALWLALLVVQGLLPAVAVYLTREVVDGVLKVIGGAAGWSAALPLLTPALFLAAALVLQVVVGGVIAWVRFTQSAILQDYISRKIHEKSVSVKMAFYDFPEYYDHLHRARDEASHRPAALLDVTGSLIQNTVTMVGIGAVLLPYGVWLPVALIVGSLPSLFLVVQNSLRRREWTRESTSRMRKTRYLEQLVTAREVAAEVRVFNLGQRFIDAYQAMRASLRREESALVCREAIGELFAALLAMAVGAAVGAWVVWQAMQGRMTAGALAMFFAAFTQAQGLVRSLLQNAGQLYSNSLFLTSLFQFLALDTEETTPTDGARDSSLRMATPSTALGAGFSERAKPAERSEDLAKHVAPRVTEARIRRGIRLEGIDFSYPGSSIKALEDFTLDVPAGRTVAIVGANGAGKSTVIKLLCRFYEPDRGRIWVDGADIGERPAPEIRQLISVLFQEPVRYGASVAENVGPAWGLGFGLQASDSGKSAATDRRFEPLGFGKSMDAIDAAVRAAGAEHIVARLPQGYNTLLGKWFEEGIELSGGEWQRLALARAFLRDAPILLLDEPTSAMDSWAEADWFERFRRAAEGRTTILITHRFTTAMQADIIHVMQDGRIVESGSHQKLLARGGRYAYSWHRQTGERLLLK